MPSIDNTHRFADSYTFLVSEGTTTKTVTITPADFKVLGNNNESNGEWVSLGNYQFNTGKEAFVVVVDKTGKGEAIADAIIFKPIN